jgi:GntR family transcriptional regulator
MRVTNNGVIDRQSPVPYYQQLVDVLAQRIESGEIATGTRLPSEAELGNEFGLARATIRQALQSLESRGLVHRIARRGVFASEPPSDTGWMIQGPEGFLENALTHQNRSVSTRVLRHGTIDLPAHAARSLEVATGSRGFELVRVRSVDGVPAVFSTNYSPEQIVPIISTADEVLSGTASYSELLARAGYALGGAHRIIHALAPSPEVAEALDTPLSTPVLRIRSVAWTSAGERYDLYETWVRSDVIPLEVNVSTVDLTARS